MDYTTQRIPPTLTVTVTVEATVQVLATSKNKGVEELRDYSQKQPTEKLHLAVNLIGSWTREY